MSDLVITTPVQHPTGLWSTTEVTADTLPIKPWANQAYRTMLRVVVPVEAGDVLDITGRARVTNDTGRDRGEPGYNVGVGYHLWGYDVDSGQGSSGPWWRLGERNGDNVDRGRHHMPLHTEDVYRVPADWPTGHRIVVVFRGDAHSTAAVDGDTLTVDDGYGVLTVRRWSEAA